MINKLLFSIILLSSCSVWAANSPVVMDYTVLGDVTEYALPWQGCHSTHELIFDPSDAGYVWVTAQNCDNVAKVELATGIATVFDMPKGSGPHGVAFSGKGELWVSLEFSGEVVKLDKKTGQILKSHNVLMKVKGTAKSINPSPHAIAFGANGKTIWFTGKRTSTVGKIDGNKIKHYELHTLGAIPIYLVAASDGSIWGTELAGNKIFKATPKGKVTEYVIPSYNSRPIAIVPSPDKKSFWFSQEASSKVAKIDMQGNITEYSVPMTQKNMLLAGITFDKQGNLWTQSYVDQSNQYNIYPAGYDYIVKIDKAILTAPSADISNIGITYFRTPSSQTVFHRIKLGTDGLIWFTELRQDQLGKVETQRIATPPLVLSP